MQQWYDFLDQKRVKPEAEPAARTGHIACVLDALSFRVDFLEDCDRARRGPFHVNSGIRTGTPVMQNRIAPIGARIYTAPRSADKA